MRLDQQLATGEPSFSFEFFPPKTEKGEATLFRTLDSLKKLEPTYISVTYGAGGTTREGTIRISSKVQDMGIQTLSHLSCVGETREGIATILDQLAERGVESIMALRGDPPRGAGEFVPTEGGFTSSVDLISFIRKDWDFTVGASCFPEVHPEALSPGADLDFLKRKVDAGASFLITQLFFDNGVFFDWQDKVRAAGIDVPISVGIMPITSYEQITRFCQLCGANIPAPLAAAMEACDGDQQAEMELGIAYATRQCEELLAAGVPGLHFYALNKAPATRAILAALKIARPWQRAEEAATPA